MKRTLVEKQGHKKREEEQNNLCFPLELLLMEYKLLKP